MVSDDFSFPTIIEPVPNFVTSTSLWRVPSVAFMASSTDGDDKEERRDADSIVSRKEENFQSEPRDQDSSTFINQENSQGHNSKGSQDSSTLLKEENSQGKRIEDPSTSLVFAVDNCSSKSMDNEEKMDMLWEDFNEVELRSVSSLHNKKDQIGKVLFDSSYKSYEGKVKLFCVQGRSNSLRETTTVLAPRRPASAFLVLKVLKKLFLLQNSQYPKSNKSIDLY
ncbi:hypothetical protein MKW98_000180 [Papaver atlanticum]|uniref:Uncharacterized protein n=1 Tax=Papaver atlanticum TaxID=357466 RepID=A0AAD4SRG9_9MAGN|nr:hypothetical protein MKW98_000180 [Papaver atlanticum]